MAPRTAAALAAAAATFGIEQLPDELLIRCLGRLNAADRCVLPLPPPPPPPPVKFERLPCNHNYPSLLQASRRAGQPALAQLRSVPRAVP